MTKTKPGSLRIMEVSVFHRRCVGAFVVGAFLGAYAVHSVFVDGPSTVPRALVEIGDHLCRQWDGLAEIGRVDRKNTYAFRCHSLAVFPQVEITLVKDQDK